MGDVVSVGVDGMTSVGVDGMTSVRVDEMTSVDMDCVLSVDTTSVDTASDTASVTATPLSSATDDRDVVGRSFETTAVVAAEEREERSIPVSFISRIAVAVTPSTHVNTSMYCLFERVH